MADGGQERYLVKEQHLLTIQQESEGTTLKKLLTPKSLGTLLSRVVVYGVLLATPVQGRTLVNLTSTGASIAAGNAACPDQPYFRYVGGKPDNFDGPTDPVYPSPDLVTFMSTTPSVQGIVKYDFTMGNGRFGDRFNLQNTRSVCYAVIKGTSINSVVGCGGVETQGVSFCISLL